MRTSGGDEMDVWVGGGYGHTAPRLLILLESWWGDVEPLADFVPKWAEGRVVDATFARLFNACSGWHTGKATTPQRRAWWDSIAFYNFVVGTVGPTCASRPTKAHYEASRSPLRRVLDTLTPKGVWIVGLEHARYSAPVVKQFGAVYEVVKHPRSGIRNEALGASWRTLKAKIED